MEFELSILRSLISDGEYFNKCFNLLKQDYFKDFGNKELFKLLRKYYTDYKQRPQVSALGIMIKDVPNEEVRKTIVESVKKLQNTELNKNSKFMQDETVKFVKDAIFYRALEIGSDGLTEKDDKKMKQSQQLMEEMAKVQVDSDLGQDFDNIEQQLEYYSKREYGIKTHHRTWNKRLGSGFLPGTLNVILAAQGVGKSLLMCDLLSGMIQKGKKVLFVSLEMAPTEIIKRIQANIFDIDVNSFRDLAKTQGELDQLERNPTTREQILSAYNKYKTSGTSGALFVKEYPAGSFSALMLEDLVNKFQVEKDIKFDIIFIDYLGIMKSDLLNMNAGLYSYIKSIGEELRASAVKLGLPIISASQLNRGAINKVDNVDNSMVADSVGTNATADLMVFVLSNEEMKQKSEVLIKFTKNRYTGMTDSFMMNVDYPKMRFSDVVDTTIQPGTLPSNFPNVSDLTKVNPDNGFSSTEQKKKADNFAKTEIASINKQSMDAIKVLDNKAQPQETDWTSILGI